MADDAPEYYSDSSQLTTTAYGVNITFSVNPPHHAGPNPPQAKPQAVVRISLEQAKVIAMLLRKQLKEFERQNGEIPLPPGLYTALGVAKEDWGF